MTFIKFKEPIEKKNRSAINSSSYEAIDLSEIEKN
jgi:hypothetical protein